MADATISRRYRDTDITLHTATSLATTLDMRDMSGAVLSIGTISTNATTLQMWGSHRTDQPFRQLYKTDGSAATITLAPSTSVGRMYSLPDEVFAVEFLKIVSATTNSTGTVGVVMLKS